jgi:hypothetical protein
LHRNGLLADHCPLPTLSIRRGFSAKPGTANEHTGWFHSYPAQGPNPGGSRALLDFPVFRSLAEPCADRRQDHQTDDGLRAHVAEVRGRSEDDGVVVREFVHGRDGRGLVQLHAGFLGNLLKVPMRRGPVGWPPFLGIGKINHLFHGF